MKSETLHTWAELQNWLDCPQWQEQHNGKPRFAFRGQVDSHCPLRTSLARLFYEGPVASNEWRRRELKMYRMFRERLLETCPGMYDAWRPLDVLALMQHHGLPTRMLDFTFSPGVAVYFALNDACGESAIWVVDCAFLEQRREQLGLPDYCGPTHSPEYDVFHKELEARYRSVGSIMTPRQLNERLAAQRGCFFVQGSISMEVPEELLHTKVIISEAVAFEALSRLRSLGFGRRRLFPNLDTLADEVRGFAVTGNADWPSTNSPAKRSRRK
jgi:hypothetical protein